MPGIQINSLQDLLLLREINDRADPFKSGLKALADGVSRGIETAREEAKKTKQDNEDLNKFLQIASGKKDRTNSGVIKRISFEPGKGVTTKFSIPTDKEALEQRKLELEIGDLEAEESTRIGVGSIELPDIAGTTIERQPLSGSIQRAENLVVPERTASLKAKKVVDLSATQAVKRAEKEVAVEQQVESQQQKAAAKAETDLLNARLKIDNTLDSFLDTAERTMDLTGAGPGVLSGTLSGILGPIKLNEFYDGFKGGLIEFAAAAGRISIPGSRAARLVNIFKKTAPTQFSTVESAIQTSADSFRNGLASDMANHPEEYIFQNLPPDEARKVWEGLSKSQKIEMGSQLSVQLREWEESFRDGALEAVYKRNPRLLSQSTRNRLGESLSIDASTLQEFGLNPEEFEIVR